MIFEIDVSGEDILNKDYIIVIADKNNFIKGFKFDERLIRVLKSRLGEGKYRYNTSNSGKASFRIRLYCTIIYYLFKALNLNKKEIKLEICRDFYGHEQDINTNLKHFLMEILGLKIEINYTKFDKNSNADKYAYLMRKDSKNKMDTYVEISLEDIEKFLKK
ncbi:hypothetical protein J4405_00070 [Candidatus Woesearchaeota archaeon]|nr:hypothetical protein [Candidatus Woesearchaeota archaeon]